MLMNVSWPPAKPQAVRWSMKHVVQRKSFQKLKDITLKCCAVTVYSMILTASVTLRLSDQGHQVLRVCSRVKVHAVVKSIHLNKWRLLTTNRFLSHNISCLCSILNTEFRIIIERPKSKLALYSRTKLLAQQQKRGHLVLTLVFTEKESLHTSHYNLLHSLTGEM